MTDKNKNWKETLPPEVYHVTREKGTEPAFSGKLLNNHERGMYTCACCGAELFSSETKFDSGTGWPSFHSPAAPDAVAERPDKSLWRERTETVCPHCGAHLGHVFDDGPTKMPDGAPASGRRFCINSVALDFKPADGDKKN